MRSIIVNCDSIHTEAEFWSAYISAAAPEGVGYFGQNLDAFWDALNGGPGWPGECELKFINTYQLQNLHHGRFIHALRDIASQSKFVKVILE
jgi:ribonuclease inhibitor